MIAGWHDLLGRLPWAWADYRFMQDALLAILLAAPAFGLLSTAVVGNRLVFFSDVLGHSALTGIAVGTLFGLVDPLAAMIGCGLLLAAALGGLRRLTAAATDTVLGVVFSLAVALGVVLLTRAGSFARFTGYLVGDVLAILPQDLLFLAGLLAVTGLLWVFGGNALTLMALNPVVARSRGVRLWLVEGVLTALLAVTVMVSIRLIGILVINSLLVLPAATARLLARTARGYAGWSVGLSLLAGVAGLLTSFYAGSASGATIALYACGFYLVALICHRARPA